MSSMQPTAMLSGIDRNEHKYGIHMYVSSIPAAYRVTSYTYSLIQARRKHLERLLIL